MTATKIDAMPIKCVAPWAGGKRTLAPRIVELLGPHNTYAEPFVGGCSILPVKPKSKGELLFDDNPKVAGVLTALRDCPVKIAGILSTVEFDREQYDDALGRLADFTDPKHYARPEFAISQLIVWWMGPSGLAGTMAKPWFASRKTATGGSPAVRWQSFKASLPALSERLQGTHISRQYYSVLEAQGDSLGTAIYADPPYFEKAFTYECDFAYGDHVRLARVLNRFEKARVVLSYYDVIDAGMFDTGKSLLDELYPPAKWRKIEVEMSKNSASSSGTAKRATEVLLVNDA